MSYLGALQCAVTAMICSCGAGVSNGAMDNASERANDLAVAETNKPVQPSPGSGDPIRHHAKPVSVPPAPGTGLPHEAADDTTPRPTWYCYRRFDSPDHPDAYKSFCHRTEALCEEERAYFRAPGRKFSPCRAQQGAYCVRIRGRLTETTQYLCGETIEKCRDLSYSTQALFEKYELLMNCKAM